MTTPKLISIQIGKTQTYTDDQGTWETAFFKVPVSGPVFVEATGLEGDSQTNKKHHGGPEKAVLVYSADHYPQWKEELGRKLPYGGFAENLTVCGLNETTVCIGDTYRIGEVQLQVTQARVPCSKIPRRWGMPDLLERVLETGRFGWYCRVLQEGQVEAGLPVALIERPYPDWSAARAFEAYTQRRVLQSAAQELASLELLSEDWHRDLIQS
jgi:MOSC domain-containing protein YiiM